MHKFIVAVALLICSSVANAANWYMFSSNYSNDSLFFFDHDTVTRHGDEVTLWEKYVRDLDKPDTDGSYSTAMKVTYSCSKRTSRHHTYSTYDKNGDFIRSSQFPGEVTDIVPDSVGEGLLKVVCGKNFPREKAKGDYFPVKYNDIFAFAKTYFSKLKASKFDLVSKSAKWYFLVNGSTDSSALFFDYNSIEKQGDTITLLLLGKRVLDLDKPDTDDIYAVAMKTTCFCSKRTSQILASSIYDKNGDFIRTFTDLTNVVPIKGNAMAEGILNVLCGEDFPQPNGSEAYKPVDDNDPSAAAKRYFDYLKAAKNDSAPK